MDKYDILLIGTSIIMLISVTIGIACLIIVETSKTDETTVIQNVDTYNYKDNTVSANNVTIENVHELTIENGNLTCHHMKNSKLGQVTEYIGLGAFTMVLIGAITILVSTIIETRD